MSKSLVPTTQYDRFRSLVYRVLRWPYLTTGLFGYLFVLVLVIAYLNKPAEYKSELDLVLPGTGASSNVSLNEVGQVVSQTTAPFASGGFNPRVNYKEMLSSRGVLERASKTTSLTLEEFGEGKIKLTEQTSILSISILGLSPQQVQEKAWAIYHALQSELDFLRADEVERRDTSIKNVLQQYRERMNLARNNIVDFQQRALLVSKDQVDQLISTLSRVNEKHLNVQSAVSELTDYIHQMSLDLGVSPQLAGKALMLQSDAEFRGYLSELDASTALLTEYRSRWGTNHPKVVAQKLRFDGAKSALKTRAQLVTGKHVHNVFDSLNLEHNPKRAQLFADLIEAYARKEGQLAMKRTLSRSSLHLSDQLKVFSREAAELDRLQREFDLAEAVFTSAAARLEVNKSDVFASYPVVQLLTSPSFPTLQTSPNMTIALVAGGTGVVFITLGLVVLWQRKAIIQLILKKS